MNIETNLLLIILFGLICPCYGSASCFSANYASLVQSFSRCLVDLEFSLVASLHSSELPKQVSTYESAPSINSDRVNVETTFSPPAPAVELASFDEWKQKILSAENSSEKINSVTKTVVTQNSVSKKAPLNFASIDCGARIVASNPEAVNVHTLLTDSTDEYANTPCSAPRKYFVVELCDSVAISEIEIGNLELFSSLPKLYNISISDRYPAKEWLHLGKFYAKEERVLSSFKTIDFVAANGIVKPLLYAKFVKVEVLEYYGKEHYCPLTAIRVYGSGLLEDDDDDEDGESDASNPQVVAGSTGSIAGNALEEPENGKPPNTLFNAAKNTVIQIFQHVLPPRVSANETVSSENQSHAIVNNSVVSPSSTILQFLYPCLHCIPNRKPNIKKSSGLRLCIYYRLFTDRRRSAVTNPPKLEPGSAADSKDVGAGINGTFEGAPVIPNEAIESETSNTIKAEKVEDLPSQILKPSSTEEPSNSTEAVNPPIDIKVVVPTKPSGETNAPHLAETEAPAVAKPSHMVEQLIVDSLMNSAEGLAKSEEDGSGGNAGELFSSGDKIPKAATPAAAVSRPVGQLGKLDRRNALMGASASSKQLLVRFVSRVRELEVNLSLTNRYLEELSLNYRKRLDEMKTKVDSLVNITSTQAHEIERLTLLLNSTSRFYENAILLSKESEFVYVAVPFAIVIVLGLSFVALFFICICKGRSSKRDPVQPLYQPSHQSNGIRVNDKRGSTTASYNQNTSLCSECMNNSFTLASAPVSPRNGSLTIETPLKRISLSDSLDNASCFDKETPNNGVRRGFKNGGMQWPDSGIADCLHVPPVTPLVVPTNLSQSFLLSPSSNLTDFDGSQKNHKKHRHKKHGKNGHINGNHVRDDVSTNSNGSSAKSISPHRISVEK